MKKNMVLVFCALFMAASVQAAVVVKQGKKVTKYENGQVIRVTGKAAAEIDYNGVKITIPQGASVIVRQNQDGSVRVTGANMNGVVVNGNTISASNNKEVVSFSVSSETGKMKVHTGTLTLTNPQGKTTPLAAGAVFAPASSKVTATSAETAAPVLPSFVNEAVESSAAAQQAVQNVNQVNEEKVLSPSAPR